MGDFYRRSDWSDVDAWFQAMGVADGVAVHHTASAAHPWAYDPDVLRSIEHGELAAGYNALAYHAMNFDNGDIAESRPLGVYGAATGDHNHHTIAICFVGYFHPPFNHVPSEASVHSAARWIRGAMDLGFLTPDATIMPHTWWTAGTRWATACAGNHLNPRVPDIESMVRGAIPSPTTSTVRGGLDMIVGFVVWEGAVLCYLINDDGRVVREFPRVDLNNFGFPSDASNIAERHGLFRLTPAEWGSIVRTGALPPVRGAA